MQPCSMKIVIHRQDQKFFQLICLRSYQCICLVAITGSSTITAGPSGRAV
jgi:hypothetical protein